MTFIKKGYGRIYVSTTRTDIDPVQFVVDAIRQLDESEFGYLPKEKPLVVRWDPEKPVELIYTHKFEGNIEQLTEFCWRAGVFVWCITQHHERWTGLPQPLDEK